MHVGNGCLMEVSEFFVNKTVIRLFRVNTYIQLTKLNLNIFKEFIGMAINIANHSKRKIAKKPSVKLSKIIAAEKLPNDFNEGNELRSFFEQTHTKKGKKQLKKTPALHWRLTTGNYIFGWGVYLK